MDLDEILRRRFEPANVSDGPDDPDEPAPAAAHPHFQLGSEGPDVSSPRPAWTPLSASKEQPPEHPLVSKFRLAIRAELGELIGEEGDMREMIRGEVERALRRDKLDREPRHTTTLRHSVISRHSKLQEHGIVMHEARRPSDCDGRALSKGSEASQATEPDYSPCPDRPATTLKQFSKLVKSATAAEMDRRASRRTNTPHQRTYYQEMSKRLNIFGKWVTHLQEPNRSGPLADAVTGKLFEALVCTVIFVNCGYMVRIADIMIQSPQDERPDWLIWEWFFQTFYTVEMVLKLIVHRQYFFCNMNWKLNMFDMLLVIGGFISLLAGHELKGGVLRLARSLKFGKAIRAMRILARLKHLRAFLVCLQGSVATFFWSMVMLGCVYGIVSLYLMQAISLYLKETGEELTETGDMGDMFPTVSRSMLTLFEASTGGEDWSVALRAIWATGWSGCAVYLLFIAFVQLAVINIITGIFVESAMITLSPDSETLAVELIKKEEAHAKELAALCNLVSKHNKGKLTPGEFRDGLQKGRIPLLLTLLGLERHHVEDFFWMLYHTDGVDEQGLLGEVDIAEFVDGCMKLKGVASNYDMQMMHAELRAGFTEFKAMHAKLSETLTPVLTEFRKRG